MKKQIPKFDQKAWDEKQAKVSDEANGKSSGSAMPAGWQNIIDTHKKWIDSHISDALIYGSSGITLPKAFPRVGINPVIGSGIGSSISLNPSGNGGTALAPQGLDPGHIIYHDQYDQYLFGGDSEDTMELPKGYFDQTGFDWASTGASNPAKTNCELNIHEYVNVGFHHDKFVCKNCNKDKE